MFAYPKTPLPVRNAPKQIDKTRLAGYAITDQGEDLQVITKSILLSFLCRQERRVCDLVQRKRW